MKRLAPLLALLTLAIACASLDPIPHGECGNRVIEAHEDCDVFAAGPGTVCRAPGEEGECRLDCARGKCPGGWGCGVDRICRQPSGAFVEGGVLASGVNKLRVGDLDGDERADVVSSTALLPDGTAKTRVHFVGSDGRPDGSLDIGRIGSAEVVPLGRGRAILGTRIGAVHFTVDAARELVPALNPVAITEGAAVFFPVFVDPRRPAPEGARDVVSELFVARALPDGEVVLEDAATTPHEIARLGRVDVKRVRFLTGAPGRPLRLTPSSSICGDILAWEIGGRKVTLASPCVFVTNASPAVQAATGSPVITYELPSTFAPTTGIESVFVGNAFDATSQEIYLAGRDLTDGLARLFTIDPLRGISSFTNRTTALPLRTGVVAVGDLDGDGKGDVVTSQRLLLSRGASAAPADGGAPAADGGSPLAVSTLMKLDSAWTEAVVGDFDGDGRTDVTARVAGKADLDLVTVHGVGPTLAAVRTEGAPEMLAAGDFDGDGVSGVAYAEPAPSVGGAPASRVRIVHGSRDGGPRGTVTVGVVTNLVALTNAGALDGGAILGALDNLLVTTIGADDDGRTRTRSYLVLGSAERIPTAPILPVGGISAAAVAARLGSRTARDVLMLPFLLTPCTCDGSLLQDHCVRGASYAPVALSRSSPTGSEHCGSRPAPWPMTAAPPQIRLLASKKPVDCRIGDFTTVFALDAVRLAAGDLDGDGRDEVIVVASTNDAIGDPQPKLGPGQVFLVRQRASAPEEDCRLASAAKFGTLETTPIATLTRAIDRDADLAIADVDGDGRNDVVLVQGISDARELVVLFNEGSGKLAAPAVVAKASAFGFARVLAGPPSLVAAVTQESGVALQRLDMKRGGVATNVPLAPGLDRAITAVTLQIGRPLEAVSAIVGGDVDGDGVDDLVVVDRGEARVFRGRARD